MALPDPITRREQYYSAIAGNGETPEAPITREEQYLDYIAKNSGGSGLPPVTGSGKALVAIDNQWVEQSGYAYEETGEEIEIVSENVTTTDMYGLLALDYFETPFAAPILAGKIYTVTFDGTVYQVTADGTSLGLITLGAPIGPGGFPDFTDYPFSVLVADGRAELGTREAGTYAVTITSPGTVVHTFDPKYLPAESKLPEVTAEDDGKFMRVVDGKWKGAEVETTPMTVTYDDDTSETFNIFVESTTE